MAFKLSALTDTAALAEMGLGIAQRVGKWGIPGVVLYCLSSVLRVIQHPSWDTVEGALSTVGIGLVLIAILARAKRTQDMIVNNAVDAKADRAQIAAAVGVPASAPTSPDKAIQRGIDKQVALQTPEGVRLTPLGGVPIPPKV